MSPVTRNRLIVVVSAAACATFGWIVLGPSIESTDNAQVDGRIHAISASVRGTVYSVHVNENQRVSSGDLLLKIDDIPFRMAIDEANARVQESESNVLRAKHEIALVSIRASSILKEAQSRVQRVLHSLETARLSHLQSSAELEESKATLAEAQVVVEGSTRSLNTARRLFQNGLLSRQQLQEATELEQIARKRMAAARASMEARSVRLEARNSELETLEAALAEARAQLIRAETVSDQLNLSESELSAAQALQGLARAELAQAQFNLTRTKLRSPVPGIVTHLSVEQGEVVVAGQPLLTVVSLDDIWITANFKETQIAGMRQGQSVIVKVDAYEELDISGWIESISPATGAKFSLLPPENASGNFVKVVQRIPVRIKVETTRNSVNILRPGMSVTAQVRLD